MADAVLATKAVRCDRNQPCINCQQRGTACTKSPRVARPRRQRQLDSAPYLSRIRYLERQLEHARSVNSSISEQSPSTQRHDPDLSEDGSPSNSVGSSAASLNQEPTVPPHGARIRVSSPPFPDIVHSESDNLLARSADENEPSLVMVEGPTSLSAHSKMAIGFLDRVAVVDRERGYNFDTRELLDDLDQIVQAIKAPQAMSNCYPDMGVQQLNQFPKACAMPPIEASVAAIRGAQQSHHVTFLFIQKFLRSQSLSDICLRVYFASDYSVADYIIINAALTYFFDNQIMIQKPPNISMDTTEFKSACQKNLETALLSLHLHIWPSLELVLALTLGAVHAVEILKPHWAWLLVSAAYQACHSLGYHLGRPDNGDYCELSNEPGLLFWVIYFLEKTLCLRLGRCSRIPEGDISLPMPGGQAGLNYARSMIKLAKLTGKIYESLYGPSAMAILRDDGVLPVKELSQELDRLSAESQDAMREWSLCTPKNEWSELIEFMSYSDKVLLYSMQTLIYRTETVPASPTASLTTQCIASARKALACHQSSPVVTASRMSGFLSSYMSWFIMLRPFTPYIVLFCNVIETGDQEDLQRMRDFVKSLESFTSSSVVARNHQRLFQVFHNVALRYTELKQSFGVSLCSDEIQQTHEIDSYLNAMGFCQQGVTGEAVSEPAMASFTREMADPDQPTMHLPSWFQISQQMMGLMDNDPMTFHALHSAR
ncbi:unnamed protein product [Clonostachys chloroleuca]|uniref:Xylanolytic transcriptional activator regulatory domain-containing protein n=1 Tax=Clonostachys chloroleuca TaxID=1926264 RepID=A0AA35LQ93_9HYPO|nr:unnamed protein product [Clonostachys chloroleuca]